MSRGADGQLRLDDPRLTELVTLIRRSFRVRENSTPVYVDVAGNLSRIALDQHQVVFGRRGSGKSCLLVYFRREVAPDSKVKTVYLNADTIKTLDYPDVLIRLLLQVFEDLPAPAWYRGKAGQADVKATVKELRELLNLPSASKLRVTREKERDKASRKGLRLGRERAGLDLQRDTSTSDAVRETRESKEEKVRLVDGRLSDYKALIQRQLGRASCSYAAFIVDDFYLVNPDYHAEVIDYLHRLLRDTDLFLKIGTVRHRTRLAKTDGIRYGVQPYQDIDTFNLDQTLEDLERTSSYLEDMLRRLGAEVGLEDALACLSDEARKELVLLSGGVPRDYLNIFVEGLGRARNVGTRSRITPTDLRQAAASLSYESKFGELRDAAGGEAPALETLFVDLVKFCLTEKRQTAFLISKDDIQAHPEVHDLIQQLMDFKLIHLVEPSTSAASGRPGRFEAYTLDFALFMEPRKRNIEIVRFWETDDQRRRVRLREAPVYELARGRTVISGEGQAAEEAIRVATSLPAAPADGDELRLFEGTG